MQVEFLARLQFAFTIAFHYIYPPLSIGLGVIIVLIEALWLKTRDPLYLQMSKFWDKVKPKTHFLSALMVSLGAHFSAVWIIVANSWQQTPAGYHLVGHGDSVRAEITDFWSMVFNPSSVQRLTHTVVAAWQAGAFLVLSVSAFYLLKRRHVEFAVRSFKI